MLVPPDEPAAVAAALLTLLDDASLRVALSAGAASTAAGFDHRTWSHRLHEVLAGSALSTPEVPGDGVPDPLLLPGRDERWRQS
jgi:hypothetical protein